MESILARIDSILFEVGPLRHFRNSFTIWGSFGSSAFFGKALLRVSAVIHEVDDYITPKESGVDILHTMQLPGWCRWICESVLTWTVIAHIDR